MLRVFPLLNSLFSLPFLIPLILFACKKLGLWISIQCAPPPSFSSLPLSLPPPVLATDLMVLLSLSLPFFAPPFFPLVPLLLLYQSSSLLFAFIFHIFPLPSRLTILLLSSVPPFLSLLLLATLMYGSLLPLPRPLVAEALPFFLLRYNTVLLSFLLSPLLHLPPSSMFSLPLLF